MDLIDARLQCHRAIQMNTRLARGFIPAKADDSHTSLAFLETPGSGDNGALAGQSVDSPSGPFRLAVSLASLTAQILDASGAPIGAFFFDGHTEAEAQSGLAAHLRARGLDPAPLAEPLHFSLDDHPLAHGARFSLSGAEPQFQALARHYANAAKLLEEIRVRDPRASAVACWPHHFDIATLMDLSGDGDSARAIGVGLSPGDHNFPDPYYYVTPWPYPDPARLWPLTSGGFWNTREWTGAVLPAGSLTQDSIRPFLAETLAVLAEPHPARAGTT